MKRLSIITACYNSGNFLKACILEVANQGCSGQVEHIIVDGGSKDNTLEILEEFSKKFTHIRWISEPDSGQSEALNKGIRMAGSDIVAILNVDDRFHPGTLPRWLQIMDQHEAPFFLYGNCENLDGDGNHLYWNVPRKVTRWSILAPEVYPFPINPAAYCYSKVLHELVGYYREDNHLYMDYEFLAKARQIIHFNYYPEAWGIFVRHEASKTSMDVAGTSPQKGMFRFRWFLLWKQPLGVQAGFWLKCFPLMLWPSYIRPAGYYMISLIPRPAKNLIKRLLRKGAPQPMSLNE